MSKLLRSDFRRLFRSKLFYLCLIPTAVVMVFALFNNLHYLEVMENLELPLDNLLFMGTTVIGFPIAIFTSFFVGTEYSDGTMRNKILVGNSRVSIYLSHFIATSVASLAMLVVGTVFVLFLGVFWMGWFITSPAILIPQILCCLLSVIALNSIIVALAMLIHHKAICAVVCLVITMLMVNIVAPFLWDRLEAAEPMTPEMTYTDTDGVVHVIPEEINPQYPTGAKRVIMQLCYDTLPTAQMYRYGYDEMPNNIELFPLYSVLFIGVCSTAGVWVYRRRDLK